MIDWTYWWYQLPGMTIAIVVASVMGLIAWKLIKVVDRHRKKKEIKNRFKQFVEYVDEPAHVGHIKVYHCPKCKMKVYTTKGKCHKCKGDLV